MSDFSRRDFLKTTTLAGANVAVGNLPLDSLVRRGMFLQSPPTWVNKPMRWAQLTLVEDDPGKFDPQFWLDYFKRTRSDAVCWRIWCRRLLQGSNQWDRLCS